MGIDMIQGKGRSFFAIKMGGGFVRRQSNEQDQKQIHARDVHVAKNRRVHRSEDLIDERHRDREENESPEERNEGFGVLEEKRGFFAKLAGPIRPFFDRCVMERTHRFVFERLAGQMKIKPVGHEPSEKIKQEGYAKDNEEKNGPLTRKRNNGESIKGADYHLGEKIRKPASVAVALHCRLDRGEIRAEVREDINLVRNQGNDPTHQADEATEEQGVDAEGHQAVPLQEEPDVIAWDRKQGGKEHEEGAYQKQAHEQPNVRIPREGRENKIRKKNRSQTQQEANHFLDVENEKASQEDGGSPTWISDHQTVIRREIKGRDQRDDAIDESEHQNDQA